MFCATLAPTHLLGDSPKMALEYTGLISVLAKRVEQAKRTTP